MALPGHSGRLRYANAEDLPSYPSPGLRPGDAAASAAATLGWANTPASPTSTAAGPGSPRQHQPGAPSQDALLAAGWSQRHQKTPSSPPSLWVSAAANMAFKGAKSPPPTTERRGLSRQNSMHAAKGAMEGPRPRAWSSPQTPTEKNPQQSAGGAALSAATIAARPTARANTISADEAGAVPYTTLDRKMFTSNPPVKPETDEKNRADVLHASALAMARKMYDQQQRTTDKPTRTHERSSSFPGGDTTSLASAGNEEHPPVMYNNLQEAAYRLAQERLAKLQEEHEKQRNPHDYYGSGALQRTRLGTIKGKLSRRRSSSDGDLLEDKRRSDQIRKQMSLLNNKLDEVDEDKRLRDREALLAAAQRNVKAQMLEMDRRVQSDTGRVAAHHQGDTEGWGRKALVAAQARSAAGNHDMAGKVDIGGGKMVDRSEVDRRAVENVQPLLDEINELAEKEKERREAERLEEERRREKAEIERMREREIQKIHQKLKDQQKEGERARKAELKHEEKMRRDEAKAIKAERKHSAEHKEEVPLPTSASKTEATDPVQASTDTGIKRSSTVGRVRNLSMNFSKRHPRQKGKTVTESPSSPDDNSTSPTRKVRAWLLSRFPRPRSKSAVAAEDEHASNDTTTKKGFIGGAALARLNDNNTNTSTQSVHSEHPATDKGKGKEVEDPNSSMREVALAGRTQSSPQPRGGDEQGESSTSQAPRSAPTLPSTPPQRPISHVSQISQLSQASIPASETSHQQQEKRGSVSSLSSSSSSSSSSSAGSGSSDDDDDDKFVEARSEPETSGSVVSSGLTPPRTTMARGTGGAGSGLAVGGRVSPSPGRESRFSEIL